MNDFEKKASGFSEVPPEAVEHSEATKAKRERSLAQLPVYWEASKLLELHRDKRYIQPVAHGVKMVGAVIKPRRMYTTGRTIGKFLDHANGYGRMFAEGETSLSAVLRTEQVLNSYLGILCHHRTYNFIDSFRRGTPDLWKYLFLRRRKGVWTVRAKVRFRFA